MSHRVTVRVWRGLEPSEGFLAVDAGCWPGVQLALSAGIRTCGLPIWGGLPHSMATRFQEQTSQETKAEINIIFVKHSWKSHVVTSSILCWSRWSQKVCRGSRGEDIVLSPMGGMSWSHRKKNVWNGSGWPSLDNIICHTHTFKQLKNRYNSSFFLFWCVSKNWQVHEPENEGLLSIQSNLWGLWFWTEMAFSPRNKKVNSES